MTQKKLSIKFNVAFIGFAFFIQIYCFPAAAQANKESYLNIQSISSQSGIKAWLVEDHSVPVISFKFAFRDTGSKTDSPEKQGLARLASNTMDEGAGDIKSKDFQKELQDLSMKLVFNVSRDHFGGELKTLTQNKERAFELLQLALTKPRFDSEAVSRMKAANQSRIKSSLGDPKWIAARIQNDRIFESHPYGLNSGGTVNTLGSITPADLRKFHSSLGKNNLVVAVSGDITAEELAIVLEKVFSDMPDTQPQKLENIELANSGKTYVYHLDIPQTIIEISQKGVSRADKDYFAAQLLNYVLGGAGFGSRLMDEVREKRGLTYGIYTYFNEYESAKSFHVTTSTVNESVKDVLGLIHQEWEKIKTTSITAEELKSARAYLIGSLPLSLTSSDSISDTLLSLQLDNLPIDYLDTRKEKINAVTPKDIQDTAQRLLDSSKFTTILVGKPQSIENAEILKKIPNAE